jgi:hypothetical protein
MTAPESPGCGVSLIEIFENRDPSACWTGGATRNLRRLVGDQGRNIKTESFLTGNFRPMGGNYHFSTLPLLAALQRRSLR